MKLTCKLLLSLGLPFGLLLQPVCVAAEEIIVPKGTQITLQLNKNLSTKENQEGDDFDAYVIEPVYSEGRIAIPRGSLISGGISRITRPGRFKGKAVIHLLFQSIQIPGRGKIPIQAALVSIDPNGDMDIYAEGILDSTGSAERGIDNLAGNGLNSTSTGTRMTSVFWTRDKDLEIHRGSTMGISLKQDLKIPLKNQPAGKLTSKSQN